MLFSADALEHRKIVDLFDAPDGDVFARRHLVAHEVLEDDANLAIQVVQVIFAQVDSVEQNLPFGPDRRGASAA